MAKKIPTATTMIPPKSSSVLPWCLLLMYCKKEKENSPLQGATDILLHDNPATTTTQTTEADTAESKEDNTFPELKVLSHEFISKCLDHPDDPVCVRLLLLDDGSGTSDLCTSVAASKTYNTILFLSSPVVKGCLLQFAFLLFSLTTHPYSLG
jgi:hypothetical protein